MRRTFHPRAELIFGAAYLDLPARACELYIRAAVAVQYVPLSQTRNLPIHSRPCDPLSSGERMKNQRGWAGAVPRHSSDLKHGNYTRSIRGHGRRHERQKCACAQIGRRFGRLYGRRYRGPGRPRAGPAPPRHVHRRHRREGAASPVRRGDRQFDGRGGRRPRHLDRGALRGGRLSLGDGQWPRHPGRSASEVQEPVGARSDHDDAALGRQVRRQGLPDLGRPARRRRVGGQRAVGDRARSRSRAASSSIAWCSTAACRRASCKSSARP